MDNKLYEYSPIPARPKLTWPNNARVAFYVGLNIEHFEVDKPSTSIFGGTAMLAPDPLNYGWRDYGCLLYTSPSPRDRTRSRMPSSA